MLLCRSLLKVEIKCRDVSSLVIESSKNLLNSAVKSSTNMFSSTLKGVGLSNNVRRFTKEEIVIKKNIILGQGMFGKCFYGTVGPLKTCVKVLRPCHDQSILIREANVMSSLCHSSVAYLYGVCLEGKYKMLVINYLGQNLQSITLHSVFFSKSSSNFASIQWNWKAILVCVADGMKYLHEKNILHNDLKEDNVIISECSATIIDFGKACYKKNGRIYNLSLIEKQQYILKHPHICPCLRDGTCKQCMETDVYSFGRILSQFADKVLPFPSLVKLSNECMQYDYLKRPQSNDLFTFIFNLCN